METKELNVSEIQQTNVEVIVRSAPEAIVGNAVPATPAEQNATLVAQSIKAVMESMGFKKPETFESFVEKENEQHEGQQATMTERLPDRGGRLLVYLPYDVRRDINDYDYGIFEQAANANVNEFQYLDKPASVLAAAKRQVAISGLKIYQEKEGLQKYINDLPEYIEDETLRTRYKTLVEQAITFADDFYKDTLGGFGTLTSDSEFTFDEATILFGQPGFVMGYENSDGTLLGFITEKAFQKSSMFAGTYCVVVGKMYHRNGNEIAQFNHSMTFHAYSGKAKLSELGLLPLVNNEAAKAELIARGKNYVKVTEKPSHMRYTGNVTRKQYRTILQFRATGRVMVDFTAMHTMDPNYYAYFGGTDNESRNDYSKNRTSAVVLDDNVYLAMSPYVYGFSFVSKVWGEMLVSNIEEIAFREDAYDKLVMEEDQKGMIMSLVETQIQNSKRADFIDGKGGGCIFLLSGEPGTGDTLTI